MPTCECGKVLKVLNKQHLTGLEHRCLMTARAAERRGHTYKAHASTTQFLRAHKLLHEAVASYVVSYYAGGQHRAATVHHSHYVSAWLANFVAAVGCAEPDPDFDEDTMHTALVFASVYGADAARNFVALVGMGYTDPDGLNFEALYSVLRANGIAYPVHAVSRVARHALLGAVMQTIEEFENEKRERTATNG